MSIPRKQAHLQGFVFKPGRVRERIPLKQSEKGSQPCRNPPRAPKLTQAPRHSSGLLRGLKVCIPGGESRDGFQGHGMLGKNKKNTRAPRRSCCVVLRRSQAKASSSGTQGAMATEGWILAPQNVPWLTFNPTPGIEIVAWFIMFVNGKDARCHPKLTQWGGSIQWRIEQGSFRRGGGSHVDECAVTPIFPCKDLVAQASLHSWHAPAKQLWCPGIIQQQGTSTLG